MARPTHISAISGALCFKLSKLKILPDVELVRKIATYLDNINDYSLVQAEIDSMTSFLVDKLLTGTMSFKRWFGNSQVLNAYGDPLVVFHGTAADVSFTAMKAAGLDGAYGEDTLGIFASDMASVAENSSRYIGAEKAISLLKAPFGCHSEAFINALDHPEAVRVKEMIEARKEASKAEFMAQVMDKVEELKAVQAEGVYQASEDGYKILATMLVMTDETAMRCEADNNKAIESLEWIYYKTLSEAIPTQVIPVFLKIENPETIDLKGKSPEPEQLKQAIRKAKERGHDGVILRNFPAQGANATHYVVFEADQIHAAQLPASLEEGFVEKIIDWWWERYHVEFCTNCDAQAVLSAQQTPQLCPECGTFILPCTHCRDRICDICPVKEKNYIRSDDGFWAHDIQEWVSDILLASSYPDTSYGLPEGQNPRWTSARNVGV